jgi:putative (di)nucleoside polyphosphate hydrolase
VPAETQRTRYRECVGVMLVNAEGHVLVAQRADMPGTPAWQMPQGGIDWGETPRQAALRELEEEIGTAKVEILVESRDWLAYDFPADIAGRRWSRFRGQRQKWFLMRFTGCDADIDLGGQHREFNAFRWVDPDQLPNLIVAFKRQVYLAVLDEFRDYLGAAGAAAARDRG